LFCSTSAAFWLASACAARCASCAFFCNVSYSSRQSCTRVRRLSSLAAMSSRK
jgi:hypothetical protein